MQFYLTLLDTYVPDETERARGVRGGRQHPVDQGQGRLLLPVDRLGLRPRRARDPRAPAEVPAQPDLLRRGASRGCSSTARSPTSTSCARAASSTASPSGTNWVFRDESMHMAFAFDVVDTVREEEPELFDDELAAQVRADARSTASTREAQFAEDLLGGGVAGLSTADMRSYLEYVADRRMRAPRPAEPIYGSKNPLAFMELQDVQELSNFFERKVSAYQVGVDRRRSGSTRTSERRTCGGRGPRSGHPGAASAARARSSGAARIPRALSGCGRTRRCGWGRCPCRAAPARSG